MTAAFGNLSRATIWLDRGTTRRLELGFGSFEAWRDEVLAQEELDQHKLDRKIEAEQHWLRYGVTARRKRNVRRLAALQDLRQSRRDRRARRRQATIGAAEAEQSGALVIETEGIGKSFGPRPIVRDFSIRIMRGDRLGVVGANGSGKTTLVRLLIGALTPDDGTVRHGANLAMATLDQGRESLDPDLTVSEALTGGRGDTVIMGDKSKHVVGYMRDFLFTPEQARTPLRVLSGGERGRLTLARALARPSNVLVLDEPTNDLDLETLDVLEEMLGDYAGTVILISHDRDFLDRTVNAVVAPQGDGRWVEYAGGYSDMLAQRGGDLAPKAPAARKAEVAASALAREPKPAPAKAARRRLSFHEKHALEQLPERIAALRTTIEDLHRRLDDPTLYARDRQAFDQASSALAAAEDELSAAEEKWLELEILREEVEGRWKRTCIGAPHSWRTFLIDAPQGESP